MIDYAESERSALFDDAAPLFFHERFMLPRATPAVPIMLPRFLRRVVVAIMLLQIRRHTL